MKNNIGEAIKRVEDQGFKVEVEHNRFSQSDFTEIQRAVHLIEKAGGTITKGVERDLVKNYTFVKSGPNVAPRGGETQVSISKGDKIWFGYAYCSISDNFSREEGVEKALARAVRASRA